MSRRRVFVVLSSVSVAVFVVVLHISIQGHQSPKRKILYLTHSAAYKTPGLPPGGYRHAVLPLSQRILRQIGEESGAFESVSSEDCSLVNAASLRAFDALVFYTSGELPFSEEQKRDFLNFIKEGKGFVGVHSATSTFLEWPEYGEVAGGYYDGHPWKQEVVINVEDPSHPAVKHLAPSFKIADEIYQLKNFSKGKVHVLLSLETSSVDLNAKGVKRPDRYFALCWTSSYGKGRVFQTALGHRDEVWQDERFQKHLVNGIRWAMKDLD